MLYISHFLLAYWFSFEMIFSLNIIWYNVLCEKKQAYSVLMKLKLNTLEGKFKD